MDTERSRTRTCGAAGGSSPPAAAGRSHGERPRLALPSRWKPLLGAGAPGEQGLWECRPRQVTPCPAGAAGPSPGAGQSSPQGSVSPQQRGRRGSQGQKLRPRPAPPPLQGPWEAFLGPGSPGRGADEDRASSREAGSGRSPRRCTEPETETQNPKPDPAISEGARPAHSTHARGTAQGTAWGGGLALLWKTG